MPKERKKRSSQTQVNRPQKEVRLLLHSARFQRVLSFVLAVIAVFACVSRGTVPKRYRIEIGDVSQVDIIAPRDIINNLKTEQMAEAKAALLPPVIQTIDRANVEMINDTHATFDKLISAMVDVQERLAGATETENPPTVRDVFQSTSSIYTLLLNTLTDEQLAVLVEKPSISTIGNLKTQLTDKLIPDFTRLEVTEENLAEERSILLNRFIATQSQEPWKTIGLAVLSRTLKPNSQIDEEATKAQQVQFIANYVKDNPVILYKDERILNQDDVVTEDIYAVLKELNYIDREGTVDYSLLLAVLFIIASLAFTCVLLLKKFGGKLLQNANMVSLMSVCIIIGTLLVFIVNEFLGDYSLFLMPVFVVPVLLATLVGIEAAVIINIVMTVAFSIMLDGNITFLLMSFVGGTLAAFLTVNASQRRRISMSGVLIGFINASIVLLTGIISKKGFESLLNESGLVFLNGLISMVLAIGLLPFLESTFNVITPFKLLELADPNHPLIKQMLMEAPGTYHHSLMVGNLAESATREIGGNALLSRVGAYFHDIGKLKRPHFFKENQLGEENPHERLTPSLSTLIITSHLKDGDDMAMRHHLPKPIRDIIVQHHGQTLVAYFYHKALQQENASEPNADTYRYDGPKPASREAAVVLLADSVEAAVRSMSDKTRGKVEGMVRKIIKDKLDDGQLDRCDLTLRDLGTIADSFIQVLGGIFHERAEYPTVEKPNPLADIDNKIYNLPRETKPNGGQTVESDHNQQSATLSEAAE